VYCSVPIYFFRGFRALQLKRIIINVPRSSVRAAALGPVEVSGKAVGPYTLVAPLSKMECLCYWLLGESGTLGPATLSRGKMCAPLFLDDGTGTVMISPHVLEMKLYATRGRPVQEYLIRPGDPIYVLGTLQENPWAQKNPIAECDELSRIGPALSARRKPTCCDATSSLFQIQIFPPEKRRILPGNLTYILRQS